MGYLEGFGVTFKKWAEGVTTRQYLGGRGGDTDLKAPKPERPSSRQPMPTTPSSSSPAPMRW